MGGKSRNIRFGVRCTAGTSMSVLLRRNDNCLRRLQKEVIHEFLRQAYGAEAVNVNLINFITNLTDFPSALIREGTDLYTFLIREADAFQPSTHSCTLRNFMICTPHLILPGSSMKNEMGAACGTHGREERRI